MQPVMRWGRPDLIAYCTRRLPRTANECRAEVPDFNEFF